MRKTLGSITNFYFKYSVRISNDTFFSIIQQQGFDSDVYYIYSKSGLKIIELKITTIKYVNDIIITSAVKFPLIFFHWFSLPPYGTSPIQK